MTERLLDYDQLHRLLAEYRELLGPNLTQTQLLLAQEAAQQLMDLQFLSASVFQLLDDVCTQLEAQAQAQLQMLRDFATSDPAHAEWFAKNPNLKLRQSAKGGTLGSSLPGVREWPQEQRLRLDAEAYYYHAHRLLDCLQQLPMLKRLNCREIRVIRNQLLAGC